MHTLLAKARTRGETECRFRGRRRQNWTEVLRSSQSRPDCLRHLVSYAETLKRSSAECWLLSLNVICFSFSFARAQKADLWLGAPYPSSHPEYEGEPLSQDSSSHPRARQVRVSKLNVTEAEEQCVKVFCSALNSYIFLIWCRGQVHLTSF